MLLKDANQKNQIQYLTKVSLKRNQKLILITQCFTSFFGENNSYFGGIIRISGGLISVEFVGTSHQRIHILEELIDKGHIALR